MVIRIITGKLANILNSRYSAVSYQLVMTKASKLPSLVVVMVIDSVKHDETIGIN